MKPIAEKTIAVPTVIEKCRRPDCNEPAEIRGLCACDYRVAHKLVADGLVKWEELERQGKVARVKRTAKVWFLEYVGRS